jgi:ferric-chelate reductase (NADPH)
MSALKRTILSVVGPHVLSEGRVADVNEVSEHFRFIDIESAIFKTAVLRPGEKVQINTGDWNLRTYTPISINSESARLGILAFIHGKGPGSLWAAMAQVGDSCFFLGPRPSLKLPESEEPLVFYGDETAIAAATSLKRRFEIGKIAKFIFEVSNPEEVRSIVDDLGLTNVEITQKSSSGIVSEIAFEAVTANVKNSCQIILAGRAQSIQQVRRRLDSLSFPKAKITTKVYWSEGKAGLD